MKKRGISAILGVVLLILIVLLLGVVFFYGQKVILTRVIDDGGWTSSCINVKFTAGDLCYENVTEQGKEGMKIKFTARNDATIELYNFIVIAEYDGGSKSSLTEIAELESSERKRISSGFIEKIDIQEIKVIPKIRIDNNIYSCEDRRYVISKEKIKEC